LGVQISSAVKQTKNFFLLYLFKKWGQKKEKKL